MSNVQAALKAEAPLRVHISKPTLLGWLHSFLPAFLPPGFRKTMGKPDTRLPELEMGLGVITDQVQRFYRMRAIQGGIEDECGGRLLKVNVGEEDRIPFAEWSDGSRPLQLFTRWYGFAYTYPGCEIYGESNRQTIDRTQSKYTSHR